MWLKFCFREKEDQNEKILLISEGELSDLTASLIERELGLFDLILKICFEHVNKKEKPTNYLHFFVCCIIKFTVISY